MMTEISLDLEYSKNIQNMKHMRLIKKYFTRIESDKLSSYLQTKILC